MLDWPKPFASGLLRFLEACLSYAGDFALVCKLSEANTADTVIAEVCVRTAANLATVVFAGGVLSRCLLL